MKKFLTIATVVLFTVTFTSCEADNEFIDEQSIDKEDYEVPTNGIQSIDKDDVEIPTNG